MTQENIINAKIPDGPKEEEKNRFIQNLYERFKETGNIEIIKQFYIQNPDLTRNNVLTPLHLAAIEGNADYVRQFIEEASEEVIVEEEDFYGGYINYKDKSYLVGLPYTAAAICGNIECLKVFLEKVGFGWQCGVISSTAMAGNSECLELLLGYQYIDVHDESEDGLLPSAAASGDFKTFEIALQHVSVKHGNEDGLTAFEIAAFAKIGEDAEQKKMIEKIIEKGTSFDDAINAMRACIKEGNTDILRIILDGKYYKTEESDAQDHDDLSPYNMAREEIFTGMECINKRLDNVGYPIEHAVKNGKLECFKMLLEAGANINVKSMQDKPLLLLAVENDNPGMVQALIDAGANIYDSFPTPLLINNSRNVYKMNIFEIAVKNGYHKAAAAILNSTDSLEKLLGTTGIPKIMNGQFLLNEMEHFKRVGATQDVERIKNSLSGLAKIRKECLKLFYSEDGTTLEFPDWINAHSLPLLLMGAEPESNEASKLVIDLKKVMAPPANYKDLAFKYLLNFIEKSKVLKVLEFNGNSAEFLESLTVSQLTELHKALESSNIAKFVCPDFERKGSFDSANEEIERKFNIIKSKLSREIENFNVSDELIEKLLPFLHFFSGIENEDLCLANIGQIINSLPEDSWSSKDSILESFVEQITSYYYDKCSNIVGEIENPDEQTKQINDIESEFESFMKSFTSKYPEYSTMFSTKLAEYSWFSILEKMHESSEVNAKACLEHILITPSPKNEELVEGFKDYIKLLLSKNPDFGLCNYLDEICILSKSHIGAIKEFFEENSKEISEELMGKMEYLLVKSKANFGIFDNPVQVEGECPEDVHPPEAKKFAGEGLDGNPYAVAAMGILGSSSDTSSPMDLD